MNLRPMREGDAARFAPELAETDAEEIAVFSDVDEADEALEFLYDKSSISFVLENGSRVLLACGVVDQGSIGGEQWGGVWAVLGEDVFSYHRWSVCRALAFALAKVRKTWTKLNMYCVSDSINHERWMKWAKFDPVGDEVIDGEPVTLYLTR